jgi:Sigma-70 region 2
VIWMRQSMRWSSISPPSSRLPRSQPWSDLSLPLSPAPDGDSGACAGTEGSFLPGLRHCRASCSILGRCWVWHSRRFSRPPKAVTSRPSPPSSAMCSQCSCGICRVIAPQAAEDVAGDTWLQVVAGLTDFRGDERAFRAWVFTISTRERIDPPSALQDQPAGQATGQPRFSVVGPEERTSLRLRWQQGRLRVACQSDSNSLGVS